MPQEVAFIIGQVFGVVVVIFGFISFQMKTPARILVFQIIVAVLFALHYLFLGAWTAVWLNVLAMVQCVVYYYRDRAGHKGRLLPILFSLSIVAVSLLSWEGWHTLLIMTGLAIHTLSLSFSRAQSIRIAQFIKVPCCISYNILVLSFGGAFYEIAVFTSSLIGTLRNRAEQKRALPKE